MKFVQFEGGIAFFADTIRHSTFRLYSEEGVEEIPVSAGSCYLLHDDNSIELVIFDDFSNTLSLSSETLCEDWLKRYVDSGLGVFCKEYGVLFSKVFFLPFKDFYDFTIGNGGNSWKKTLDDLMLFLKSNV